MRRKNAPFHIRLSHQSRQSVQLIRFSSSSCFLFFPRACSFSPGWIRKYFSIRMCIVSLISPLAWCWTILFYKFIEETFFILLHLILLSSFIPVSHLTDSTSHSSNIELYLKSHYLTERHWISSLSSLVSSIRSHSSRSDFLLKPTLCFTTHLVSVNIKRQRYTWKVNEWIICFSMVNC